MEKLNYLSYSKVAKESAWTQETLWTFIDEAHLPNVAQCRLVVYNGEHGVFAKLYLSIKVNNEIHNITDEPEDSKYTGIRLAFEAYRKVDMVPDMEYIINPVDVLLCTKKNIDNGDVRMFASLAFSYKGKGQSVSQ